jgi:hypothetical protein
MTLFRAYRNENYGFIIERCKEVRGTYRIEADGEMRGMSRTSGLRSYYCTALCVAENPPQKLR